MKCPQCGREMRDVIGQVRWVCGCGCSVCTNVIHNIKPMTEEEILHGVQEEYGQSYEMVVAIEELSELTKELCKDMRDQGDEEAIAEEMAEVEIVLAHLKLIYKNADMVAEWRGRKLRELEQMLREEQN
jgi:hypothetical protein